MASNAEAVADEPQALWGHAFAEQQGHENVLDVPVVAWAVSLKAGCADGWAFALGVREECLPRTARSTSAGALLFRAVCDGIAHIPRRTRGSHADFVLRGPEAGHDIRLDFATRAITTTFAMRAINSYTLRSRTRASASARSLSPTFAFPSSCCRAWRQCVSVRLEVVHPQAQAPLEAFPLGVGEECAPRTARSTSVGAFLLRAVCDGYP